jgi:hypothetical protein
MGANEPGLPAPPFYVGWYSPGLSASVVDASAKSAAHGQLPGQASKRLSLVVLDEVVEWASGTATFLSSPNLDWMLGSYDQLAIEIVADWYTVANPISVSAQLQHSADGIHYVNKAFGPEIPSTPLPRPLATTVLPIGYDDGTTPSLAFVRLLITAAATGGPNRAHLKVTVTGNNTHEHTFSATVEEFIATQFGSLPQHRYGPGTTIWMRGASHPLSKEGQQSPFPDHVFVVDRWTMITPADKETKSGYIPYWRGVLGHPYQMWSTTDATSRDTTVVVTLENQPVWSSPPGVVISSKAPPRTYPGVLVSGGPPSGWKPPPDPKGSHK